MNAVAVTKTVTKMSVVAGTNGKTNAIRIRTIATKMSVATARSAATIAQSASQNTSLTAWFPPPGY